MTTAPLDGHRKAPQTMRPTTTLDDAAIAGAVTAERLALCDLLDTLTSDDWQHESLCQEWTVREVVAHLTLATRDTVWGTLKAAIKARGNWDRMNTTMARDQAVRFAPPELVRELRDTAASTRRAPFSSVLDPLADILVHAQDIVRPIGRTHPMAPEHTVPALDHAVHSRWYGGPKRFAAVTLIATDADWRMGSSADEVRGTAGALLLLATGRRTVASELTGAGADALVTRLE